VIRVQRIYHATNPILTWPRPMRPPSDFSYSKCVMKRNDLGRGRARGIERRERRVVHEAGGARMFNVIAISRPIAATPSRPPWPGELPVGFLSRPFVGVVDEDNRPDEPVRRALGDGTPLRSREDIDIIRKMWSGPLDPHSARTTWKLARGDRRLPALRDAEDFPPVARASPASGEGRGEIPATSCRNSGALRYNPALRWP